MRRKTNVGTDMTAHEYARLLLEGPDVPVVGDLCRDGCYLARKPEYVSIYNSDFGPFLPAGKDDYLDGVDVIEVVRVSS